MRTQIFRTKVVPLPTVFRGTVVATLIYALQTVPLTATTQLTFLPAAVSSQTKDPPHKTFGRRVQDTVIARVAALDRSDAGKFALPRATT